jgi:malate permease and related proteins
MAEIIGIIFNVISPIFLVMGAAYLIGRRLNPDTRVLSALLVYLFVPSLTFRGFATMQIGPQEFGGILGVSVCLCLIMAGLSWAIARFHGWSREQRGAFIASSVMLNAANYGIPLNTFAFGETGGALALLYYAINNVPSNILGVFFMSRGKLSLRGAVLNVLRVPLVYAAVAGLAVNAKILTLPLPVMRAITEIAANGSIPGMLALLGLKLAQTSLKGKLRPIILATLLRLVIAPFIAVPLALFFGLTGVAFQVAVVESSMPTAVVASALAAEFGGDAELTSAVILVSTACSVVTLSILIAILM